MSLAAGIQKGFRVLAVDGTFSRIEIPMKNNTQKSPRSTSPLRIVPPPDPQLSLICTLAEEGVPIIELRTDGPDCKKPLNKGWPALRAEDQGDDLLRLTKCNVGMPTGSASGNVVIDIDVKPGDNLSEIERRLRLSGVVTPTVDTPTGGRHYYFQAPRGVVLKNRVKKLDPSTDTRAKGGYVVLPGSSHPNGGTYEWAPGRSYLDVPVAPLPEALLAKWIESQQPAADAVRVSDIDAVEFVESLDANMRGRLKGWATAAAEGISEDIAKSPAGERNNTLFTEACRLFEFENSGLFDDDFDAIDALKTAAHTNGLPDAEAAKTINNAAARTKGKGIDIAETVAKFEKDDAYSASVTKSRAKSPGPEQEADEGLIDHAPTVGYPNADKNGVPLNCKENWKIALQKFGIHIWRDLFSGRDMVDGINDSDLGSELTDDIECILRFKVALPIIGIGSEPSEQKFRRFVQHECLMNKSHPVRDRFDSLKWDKVPRLATLLPTYFGAEDTELHREFGRLHLCAAVKRVLHPGDKFDEVLVLESGQGKDKSTAIQALCPRPEWFLDDLALGADSKVVIEQTRGKLFVELAELNGIGRKDIERVKAMVSRQSDRARKAYGHRSEDILRQFVFWGTTNDSSYLRDQTGNRRFWPVRIGKIDVAAIRRDRDQLWAEAVHLVRSGVSIRLDRKYWASAAVAQDERTIEDPFSDKLTEALAPLEGIVNVRVPNDDLWSALRIEGIEERKRNAATLGSACQSVGMGAKKRVRGRDAQGKDVRPWWRYRGDCIKARVFRWKAGQFRESPE